MMNKNIYKILFTCVLFVSVLFLNIDGVKAEDDGVSFCSCYYHAQDVIDQGYAGDYEKLTMVNDYLAEIRFTKSGDTSLIKSCLSSKSSSTLNTVGGVRDSIGDCKGNDLTLNASNIEEAAKKVFNAKCSVSACNTIELYIRDKEIKTRNNIVDNLLDRIGPLEALDGKKGFEKEISSVKSAENKARYGEDDIDIEDVKANESNIGQANEGEHNCDLIPPKIMKFLQNFFFIIQVSGVILLIFMTMIEFVKAVTASEEDGIKGAIKNTYRRIIIVIVLLLLPMIITWLLNIVNNNAYETDNFGKRIIGADGNPLCKGANSGVNSS